MEWQPSQRCGRARIGFALSATRSSPALVEDADRPQSRPQSRRRAGGSVALRGACSCRVALSAHRRKNPRQPTGTGVGWRPRSRRQSAGLWRHTGNRRRWRQRPGHQRWIHRRSAGSMASESARRGKLMCGAACARRKRPPKPKAMRSPHDYEFARQSLAAAVARAYFSTIEAAQQAANAQETLSYYSEASKLADVRKEQGHASDFDLAQIKRAPPARRTRSTSRRPRERRPSARSKLSPVTIPPAGSPRATFLPRPTASRARRSALATARTPARCDRGRTSFRRRVSSRVRSARRATAAFCDQRHRRIRNRCN